jgi:rhodanese-related sulfurtransferase
LTVRAAGAVHALPDEALGNTSHLLELGVGLAASLDPRPDIDGHLERRGAKAVNLVGGIGAWEAAGLPIRR